MDDEDLHDRAHRVAQAHADLLSAELGPGRVRGVWLIGSTMLRDLTAASDIDTVTLTDTAFGPAEHDALARVHAALAEQFPGLCYDTTYLAESALAEPPDREAVVPHSVDGALVVDAPGGEVHPVTWFSLPHAVRVTGSYPHDTPIHADRGTAREHSAQNLQSYWIGSVATGIRQALTERPADQRLEHPDVVVWSVLGAPRLAAFLDPEAEYAGPIPSKSEAGAWVVAHRPDYAELAERALAARDGADVGFTVSDALIAADLVESLA